MNWKVKLKNINNESRIIYVDAETKKEVQNEFRDEFIISIKRNYELIKKRINYKQLKDLVDEWYSLLNAGFDELSSLEIVKNSSYNKLVKTVLESILIEIHKGNTLYKSFVKQNKYFPEIFLDILKVSIESNDLKNGLHLISNFLDEQIKSKDKMKNITLYPKIIGIVIFAVICILSKFIIPAYVELFKGNNIELNKISEILLDLFIFIGDNILIIIISLIILFFLYKLMKTNRKINRFVNNIKNMIPFLNRSSKYLNTYLFCSMTNLMWLNNVNKTESLLLVSKSIKDMNIKSKLEKAYEDVHMGLTISESFIKNNIFDNVLIKMFVIGEKNNMIEKNIENAVKYYHYKYQLYLKRMMTVIEPLLLIFISLFVLVIILVVFMPMMNAFKMVN